jgi:fumarate reductase subunit D
MSKPRQWKRSNAPIFWALFGGGGTLSSLFGPTLVLVTGILVPMALIGSGTMSYARMLAFAQNPFGKLILLALIVLFAWHAVHRLYKSLHDFGIQANSTISASRMSLPNGFCAKASMRA